MPPQSLESLRLAFKRAFSNYYLQLVSPGIADPTEAFATAEVYLRALKEQLGEVQFYRRLDEVTTDLLGHLEQDLRRPLRERGVSIDREDLEQRLRECLEHGLA